jgi:hypothetical protein
MPSRRMEQEEFLFPEEGAQIASPVDGGVMPTRKIFLKVTRTRFESARPAPQDQDAVLEYLRQSARI